MISWNLEKRRTHPDILAKRVQYPFKTARISRRFEYIRFFSIINNAFKMCHSTHYTEW